MKISMQPEVKKARNVLLIVFVSELLFSMSPDNEGYRIPDMIRLVTSLFLMLFTYKGFTWAKWTMIILYFASSIIAFIFGSNVLFAYIQKGDNATVEHLLHIILYFSGSIFFGLAGFFILLSKDLHNFFKLQRKL